ncbi:disease resistance protein At4g27190-like, partial [Fagus crenata]
INTVANLPSRLDVLVREMERLVDLREQVKLKKEAAEKEGNEIRSRVIKWLQDVEKLELRVDPIQEQMHNNKKPSAKQRSGRNTGRDQKACTSCGEYS